MDGIEVQNLNPTGPTVQHLTLPTQNNSVKSPFWDKFSVVQIEFNVI
jgi:hypothetical protein